MKKHMALKMLIEHEPVSETITENLKTSFRFPQLSQKSDSINLLGSIWTVVENKSATLAHDRLTI